MHRIHGFNYCTIRKYYPDYRVGNQNRKSTEELLKEHEDVINRLAAERAPGSLIAKAVGISYEALSRHRPELMWTKKEAAAHATAVSSMNKIDVILKGVK